MLRIAFSDRDIEQLRYERYHHPHPRVQQKMEALLLKSQDVPHHVIAGCVGVCENTLLAYFRAYQAGGIEALKQINFHRPSSALEAHRTSLEAYFRDHPPTTIAEAAVVIERLTGVQRKPTQVRVFLQKLGLKRLKTYAVPDKTDTERQDAFKKTRSNHGSQKRKPDNARSFL
jgi:Transposase and inactivated derivatives